MATSIAAQIYTPLTDAADVRHHRPRTDVFAVMRAQHAEVDFFDQRPDTVGVAVIGHGIAFTSV